MTGLENIVLLYLWHITIKDDKFTSFKMFKMISSSVNRLLQLALHQKLKQINKNGVVGSFALNFVDYQSGLKKVVARLRCFVVS